jgi:hypothetical protein
MKALVLIMVSGLVTLASKANDPYRDYLLSKIYLQPQPKIQSSTIFTPTVGASAFIPRFERPKGAIFCRMEDKVTKATKVWLKIGVQ